MNDKDKLAAGSVEAERAAFEAYFANEGKSADMWEGWQARAALDSRAPVAAGELPSIQRYDISPYYDALDTRPAKDGEWVKYEEHQNAINALQCADTRPAGDDLQTIRDRDEYHEWADKLADAIAKHCGVDIGEHSNLNCPWGEALEAIEGADSRPAGGVDWLGLALDLEQQAKRVESKTVERAMAAAAHGLRLMGQPAANIGAPVAPAAPDLAKRLNELDKLLADARLTQKHPARQFLYGILHDVCGGAFGSVSHPVAQVAAQVPDDVRDVKIARLVKALQDCARHPRLAQRNNIVKKALASAATKGGSDV